MCPTPQTTEGGQAYAPPAIPPAVTTEAVPPAEEGYPAPSLPAAGTGIPAGALTLTTSDGVELAAAVTGSGPTGVILAHMFGGSQADWQPLTGDLVASGYTVLTFDFRGFGQSAGPRDLKTLDLDIAAAADYLKSHGITRVICIGASMGGTACAKAASGVGAAGLVLISSPLVMETPLEVKEETLKNLSIPKLFIAAEDDSPYASEVQQMYDWSADPRQIEIVSGNAHGTNLLVGTNAETVKTLILDFLMKILE